MRLIDPIRLKQALAVSAILEDKKTIEQIIDEQPTIEPEPKTGKWIFKNDLKQFFCSECGAPSLTYDDVYIYSMDLPNFCEDCGADMREGGER